MVYRIWASARMVQLEAWFRSWVLDSVFSAGGGRSSVEAWCTTALDIEEVLSGIFESDVHLFVAGVIKSFDTVDRGILDRVLSSLGLPAWFRHAYFEYRSGQTEASLEEFNEEIDGWLPLLPVISLPQLTGEMLADVVRRKGATAGSLDGWGWRELKVLPMAWFDGLARILSKVEEVGVWPDGLLDAYIATIPKTDGDATPLGQRPLSVLRWCTVFGPLLVWCSLRIGFGPVFQTQFIVPVVVAVRLRLGILLPWILRRFSLELLTLIFICL